MRSLVWRPIDTPDFRGSMLGLESFNRMFNEGMGVARSTVTGLDDAQSAAANRSIQMELLKFSDPEAYAAAMKTGQIFAGVDPRRLDAATINMAAGRTGQLLNEASTKENLDFTRYTHGQTKTQDEARARVAPLMPAYLAAAQDPAKLAEFNKANPNFMKDLNFADSMSLFQAGQTSETNFLNATGKRQDIEQSDTRFDWEKMDRETQRQVQGTLAELNNGAFDPQSAYVLISSRRGSLKPEAYNALMAAVPTMNFGQAAGAPAAPGGDGMPSFSGGAPQNAVAETLRSGGLPDAVVAGFMGNFEVEGGYSGAQGDGGSAGGIAQWRGSRRENFTKVIGKDPTQATPAEQARFVLWEMANPEAAGMTKAQVDQIKAAKSPGEAAALIDNFYERSDKKAQGRRVSAAENFAASKTSLPEERNTVAIGRSNSLAQSGISSVVANIAEARQDVSSAINDVANRLVNGVGKDGAGKDPIIAEFGVRETADKLKFIQNRATELGYKNMSAAEAGAVLRNATTTGWASSLFGSWFNRAGMDNDGVDQLIREMADGTMDARTKQLGTATMTDGVLKTAKAYTDKARDRLLAAQQAIAAGKSNVDIAAAQIQYQAAVENERRVLAQVKADPTQFQMGRPSTGR